MLDDNHHQNRVLPIHPVRALCGGVSIMTIHRWQNDPRLGFPQPLRVNRRRYWREAEILAWLDQRAQAEA